MSEGGGGNSDADDDDDDDDIAMAMDEGVDMAMAIDIEPMGSRFVMEPMGLMWLLLLPPLPQLSILADAEGAGDTHDRANNQR
jgi:hypothetical protein